MLRKKVRAVFRYCVWMLVFIKLILPPTLSLPTGIGYWCGSSLSPKKILLKPIADHTSTAESIVPDISEDFVINSKSAQARSSQVASESATAITPVRTENLAKITEPTQDQSSQSFPKTAAPITSVVTTLPPITWQAIVFLLWLVGIFVFSILLIQRMLSILGLIAQSKPTQGRLLEALDQCRRQVGIGRSVELRLSSHVQSPAVCGFFKPVILMPTTLLEELSKDKLRAVLIHELIHIKRCDLWVNFVQTFLQIIYFYNPFVWFASAVVRRLREQAVDETVLVAMGAEAKSYSNTLIDIAELAFFRTSFGLRLIGVAESKKSLHRRIRHMLSRPIPQSAKVGVFGTFVIFVIAAVLLPMASAENSAESRELGHRDSKRAEPKTITPLFLRIRAFIDGSDYIKIRGDKLWYEHLKWDLPGKWWDRLENIKYDEPTYINEEAWEPEWEGRMSKPYIMKQVILPKEVNDHINLKIISGRGSVSITGTPKPENDYTLSILLDDNRYNKAQWYEVIIQSGPGGTTKESTKGDSISSSIETLPEMPAANDLPGTLVFRGQYKHMSRGREYGQASELWLKQIRDKRITAVARMPFIKATIIASGDQENRFAHYKIEQSALGDRPGYLMDLKLLDNKVLLTRRGLFKDVDDEELKVPEGALFNPNTRPDAYCAANILLRGFNLEKGKSEEFHVYDWDNTGEAFADYAIRVKHAGTESVEVPAGKFEANHFVLTQATSADTWFKKRAGHVTDFWVLDNGVIVRVLRHREPYEIQLLEYTFPDKLPGHLSAPTTVELKQRNEIADAQTTAETTEKVPLPEKEGKVLAFDDFDGSLSLDWEILNDDPTHYSLTKKPGTLTITTQKGGFAWSGIDYDNLFLIDCPALPSSGVQITTCISGFNPAAPWQQAGLLFWNDEDNYLKWVCQFGTERTFSYLGETNAVRSSHRSLAVPQGVDRYWLRMTKRGDRYQFLSSMDGKSFVPFNAPTDPHGTPMTSGTLPWGDGSVKKIGLFVGNGLDSEAPEIDASFEFFEVRICQVEAGPQSESGKNEKPGVKTNVQVVPVPADKQVNATQKNLQALIDSAKPGDTVIVPKGIYKEPIDINKSLNLKGELRGECVFEVTADRPAIFIDTKGKGKVTVQDLTIKWQLATSNKGIERPFALGVKDTKAEIKNCSFLPLGNFQRSPVAVRVDGFSNLNIRRSRFEGFEYVICYGQGTKGKTTDCLIMDCGHQGIINYTGATLHVERNVITGSRYHAVRCTGGILYVKDNLLINNANRGIYLGNRSGSGTITNNLIINNAVGIGAFARAKYEIKNNVIADSSYSGIGMYKSCYLTIRDNIFLNNERGWVMFDKGEKGGNTSYRNTFWKNKVDDENFKKTGNSINADPGFIDPENGDFSLKPGPAKANKQGLTNPQLFKDLWKIWKNRKDKNVPFTE